MQDLNTIGLLLDRNLEIREDVMHCAAANGFVSTLTFLVARGFDVDTRGVGTTWKEDLSPWRDQTPLHAAVATNHLEAVKTLLALGANIEGITKKGNTKATPLRMAITRNGTRACREERSTGQTGLAA